MKIVPLISTWVMLAMRMCTANPFDGAVKCAADFLAANPNVPSNWMPSGTFGGNFTPAYVGQVPAGNTALPSLNMMDGPQGLRDIVSGQKLENRTSWPAAASYGQSWSPSLAFHAGKLGANDWRAVDANVALTPGVNVHRVPINGRNWEYISGEDASLGVIGGALVAGIQADNLMGSLKHWALNHQELNREGMIAEIEEASLMETYLPAYQPAIDAGIGSVMCSYNQIQFADSPDNFAHTCGSSRLSKYILRDVMGFKGAIMTDWGALMDNTTNGQTTTVRDVVEWEMAGLGQGVQVPKEAQAAIAHDSLVGMFASGIGPETTIPSCANAKAPTKTPDSSHLPQSYQTAIESGSVSEVATAVIVESMVMLKNDAVLPLKATPTPTHARVGACPSSQWQNSDCFGDDMYNKFVGSLDECCALCGADANCKAFTLFQSVCYLKSSCTALTRRDGCAAGVIGNGPKILLTGTTLLNGGGSGDSSAFGWYGKNRAGEGVHTGGPYGRAYMAKTLSRALNVTVVWGEDATGFDVVLAFGGQLRSEAYLVDGKDGYFQIDQCDYTRDGGLYGDCNFPAFISNLQTARQNGTKVVAVITSGGAHYPGEYIESVDAALSLFYPGQHFADALAAVLSGAVSPGGRLTYTLPQLEDDGVHVQSPIGRFDKGLKYVSGGRNTLSDPSFFFNVTTNQPSDTIQYSSVKSVYAEGNLVGYKYFEFHKMTPAFPFGFGLSFASFSVQSDFHACASTSSCVVHYSTTQKGFDGPASVVVQVYVGFVGKNSIPGKVRPIKELKAFDKVWGTSQGSIPLAPALFAMDWDVQTQGYASPCTLQTQGSFTISVGTSSSDIVGTTTLAC